MPVPQTARPAAPAEPPRPAPAYAAPPPAAPPEASPLMASGMMSVAQPPAPPAPAPAQPTYTPPPQPTYAAPPPPPQTYAPPPQSYPPYPPQGAPPPSYSVLPPSEGIPSWAIVVLVALLLIGAGYAGITFFRGGGSAEETAVAKTKGKFESASEAGGAGSAHPLGKHLEVTGIRVAETTKKKLQVRLVVINHSGAELPDMKLSVNLRSTAAKPGDAPISKFTVNLPSIGGYESRELKADTQTKLRAYEFPDWQFLRADFEVLDK